VRIQLKLLMLALLSTANNTYAQPASNFGTPVSTTVFVNFPNGGVAFYPSRASAETLASAHSAAMVTIKGRTSTNTPTAKDEALAFARAAAARQYLIRSGVSPLKIMVNYASASDFVADNSTPEGRLENQRVEIDLIFLQN
jgi:outer membrane protein OmpA-like peptidoglycan-associated protein